LWFLLFQLLALLIFGSIFSAIGASCSEIRDAQSMMFPAMLLIMIPLFTWMPVLQSPSSTFARMVSLFPPATPMLMLLRIAIPPGPPWWEIVLGVVLTFGFMLACVWASAKIFRIGLLSQGQAPSLARLVAWLTSR
jgi:ABC-type Na+ efflux pump permease subunit